MLDNARVLAQLGNNTPDQIRLGDFPDAARDAVIESLGSHQEMSGQLLRDPILFAAWTRLLLEDILRDRRPGGRTP